MSEALANGPCWEWSGHLHANGYGRLTNKRKTMYAHRFMWEAFNGEVPKGMDVCHTCDNRSCVNPHHMFLGSRKDNMQDAMIKGRLQRGSDRYNAILNPCKVRAARALKKQGFQTRQISRLLNVQPQTLGKAINRQTWRHIL